MNILFSFCNAQLTDPSKCNTLSMTFVKIQTFTSDDEDLVNCL